MNGDHHLIWRVGLCLRVFVWYFLERRKPSPLLPVPRGTVELEREQRPRSELSGGFISFYSFTAKCGLAIGRRPRTRGQRKRRSSFRYRAATRQRPCEHGQRLLPPAQPR